MVNPAAVAASFLQLELELQLSPQDGAALPKGKARKTSFSEATLYGGHENMRVATEGAIKSQLMAAIAAAGKAQEGADAAGRALAGAAEASKKALAMVSNITASGPASTSMSPYGDGLGIPDVQGTKWGALGESEFVLLIGKFRFYTFAVCWVCCVRKALSTL